MIVTCTAVPVITSADLRPIRPSNCSESHPTGILAEIGRTEQTVGESRRGLFGLGRAGSPASPAAVSMAVPGTGAGSFADAPHRAEDPVDHLLARTARGDTAAFETLYDRYAGAVFGTVLQVLRDPSQSEEVSQEVFVEAWRTASRFDPARGSARTWLLTMAHRRAVDRVRSSQAAGARDARVAAMTATPEYDQVSEAVELRLERAQVRRCLEGLTGLQRESIDLAFYRGYSYREVSDLLAVPLGTVKTRLRDGLIRLRDCLGVGS